MIKLQNLTKSFGSKTVLNSISLDFEAEKTHILLGSSGCGKSTILRLIVGILFPSTGRLSVDGLYLEPKNVSIVREMIGYVLQHGGLFPHLTAKENVFLRAQLAGMDLSKMESRLRELCELVSLDIKMMERYPRQISGGQQQRVGLVRALLPDPPILLLDEPLSALDPINRKNLREDLGSIFSKLNKTVVFVTHDINEAGALGDTVTLLNQGHVAQHGSIKEFFENPANEFVSEFFHAQKPPPIMRDFL